MSDPEGNSQFCFPESPDVSRDDVKGTSGLEENKTNCFPEEPDVKCFFSISKLSIQRTSKESTCYL